MATHKGTQTIETARLVLRRFRVEDARAMYANWASDPEVTRFLTWPTHPSPAVSVMVLQDWVKAYADERCYQWAIVLKENGDEPIGSIAVVSQDDKVGKAQVGYALGKAWWGQGLMTEALGAVIGYLFDQVDMQRIEARHDPHNPASGAVMRKCGMQYEGVHKRSDWNNQGLCDACWYAAFREKL